MDVVALFHCLLTIVLLCLNSLLAADGAAAIHTPLPLEPLVHNLQVYYYNTKLSIRYCIYCMCITAACMRYHTASEVELLVNYTICMCVYRNLKLKRMKSLASIIPGIPTEDCQYFLLMKCQETILKTAEPSVIKSMASCLIILCISRLALESVQVRYVMA